MLHFAIIEQANLRLPELFYLLLPCLTYDRPIVFGWEALFVFYWVIGRLLIHRPTHAIICGHLAAITRSIIIKATTPIATYIRPSSSANCGSLAMRSLIGLCSSFRMAFSFASCSGLYEELACLWVVLQWRLHIRVFLSFFK